MARKARASSGKREKASTSNGIVRTRRAGTPIRDLSTPSDERQYVDIEVDDHGNVVTDMSTVDHTI